MDEVICELDDDEMILADGTHSDGKEFFVTPTGLNNADQKMKQMARARHETVNGRFKAWGCLKNRFRHSLDKHHLVVMAIANIIQLLIETEEECVFQVDYFDA